ncbi:TetR/AcrR family transcriptional regulator [uncultured Flavobacterium sp.]|uniref:TetR/AcrR family transcriptional regulator n=1 Tax=uncultured Flavobacterium sp. TaxID=165435 RepID=UPI0030EF6C71|tara:strand:+ start:110985 stop:111554 length:570 start_codon:yes stop_codon:yes gene_type:complete
MKKDRAATEEKIYTAFLDILKEKGPQGVGINAIAKQAGVSKSLIYRYFGGMKGLLLLFAQKGDFFKSLSVIEEKKDNLENLKDFIKEGTKELRENTLTQEILRWQLIENNEDTKSLFKYFNAQVGKTFTTNTKDESLNSAFQLMLGGYVYFTLLSKFNKTFIATDLTSEKTWENFDEAIAKTIELFSKT